MTISAKETKFAGKPVIDWAPGMPLENARGVAYRISAVWTDQPKEGGAWSAFTGAIRAVTGRSAEVEPKVDRTWRARFLAFLQNPNVSEVTAIVVGPWDGMDEVEGAEAVVEDLSAAASRLPRLTGIFLGDITVDECEISWIKQGDVSPLLRDYPRLEHLRVRGAGLTLGRPDHDCLKSLTVETGGLDASVIRDVCAARLPALEHLELWLGDDYYLEDGAVAKCEDLQPILAGGLFPRLQYLGLRDSMIADDIAIAVAASPILAQIKVLDLSLGTLSDAGAEALLGSDAVRGLEKLDLHHHYLSPELERRLEGLGIEVDVSERQEAEEDDGELHRYVAVSE